MIVAIQQPEHLPWIGFFNKMAQSESYVYLDNVQYKKRYFENRNMIKTKSGAKWLTVPVSTKGRFTQDIKDVIIDNTTLWVRKYRGTLEQAYKTYPFWHDVEDIVLPCIEKGYEKLIDLNIALINSFRKYFNIGTPVIFASSLDVKDFKGNDLILEIAIKAKATIYISGPDGEKYLDSNDFIKKGINIEYHNFLHPDYPQKYGDFLPYMSTIDLIANCGPESAEIIKKCYKIGANGQ